MAQSDETSNDGIVGNFQDLLGKLDAEYQQVCVDNSNLLRECSQLRDLLRSQDARNVSSKEDDNTTFHALNWRQVSQEDADHWPQPQKTPSLDEHSAVHPEPVPQAQVVSNDCTANSTRQTNNESQSTDLELLRRNWRSSITDTLCALPFGSKTSSRLTLKDALRRANLKVAATSRLVINPDRSKFIRYWDQVMIVALVFVAIVTPVQVAMMSIQLDILFVINNIVDLFFFVDMVLQFFLMYPVSTNFGMAMEHRHHVIVRHYLTGWFIIDLVCIAPIDIIAVFFGLEALEEVKAVKAFRLLRLLKLARIRKVSRLFRHLEMRMAIPYQQLALAKFLTMLFLVTHWMANLWALTLVLVEEDSGVPRWVDSFDEMEANVVGKTKEIGWKTYLACLYFTSYTITSVGYGDIGPKNVIERIVCTLMIFVSGITWALLIAQVCSIVSSMDADDQSFRKFMDELNYMMKTKELPEGMRRRLRSFFLSNKISSRHIRFDNIVNSMSPALRGEVCLEINRIWIQKVSFLKALGMRDGSGHRSSTCSALGGVKNFMVDVSRALALRVFAQGESFGDPQVLYILNRGLASHNGRVLRSGAVWGSDFVLSNTAFLHPFASFALTYVEVTCLERETFLEIVNKHSKECPQISKTVRWYSGWLALQRCILLEAARKREQQGPRRRRSSLAQTADQIMQHVHGTGPQPLLAIEVSRCHAISESL